MSLSLNRHIILSNKLLVALSGVSTWTIRDGEYVYEKHQYHISTPYLTQKWTKTAIKQFLAYVSLCNAEGHISFLSEEELASEIGCSVRSVQENNKSFIENGLITSRRIWGEFLDVQIVNYIEEVRDLVIEEDGTANSRTGYTSIWHQVIKELMKISNINELRLALRCLLLHEKEVHVQQLDEAVFSYDEIKGFLPKYIGYRKAIKNMTQNLSNFLHISCLEKKEMVQELYQRQIKKRPNLFKKLSKPFALTVSLFRTEDSRIIRNRERHETLLHWFEFKKQIRGYLPVHQSGISQSDLHTLSDTYGSDLIREGLERIANLFVSDDYIGTIHNLHDEFNREPLFFIQNRIHSIHSAKTALN